jgi:protein O-GlcNAc transferase
MGLFDRFRRPAPAAGAPAAAGAAGPAQDAAEAGHLIEQGNALEDRGALAEARACYEEAVRKAPSLARAHLNLGNALLALGDPQAALQAYSTALSLQPGYAAAHYNIGNAYARLRRRDEAVAAYREALRAKPGFVDAEVALGNVQEDLRQFAEAAASYRRALTQQPEYAQVQYNLGRVLLAQGDKEGAEAACRRAVELRPDLADAHNSLGVVYQARGRHALALSSFRQALAIDPEFAAAAAQAYHCAKHLCDWSHIQADEAALARRIERGAAAVPPFNLIAMEPPPGVDAALLQRRAALQFAQERWAGEMAAPLVPPTRHALHDRLRIGYLSADFSEHATMHLLRGVLAHHDRSRLAIHAYSYGGESDAMTDEARRHCEVFRDVSALSNAQAAALIAADEIDILVELKGFTQNARMEISAQRPAPVIASWLGYPGTLGDARLADYLIGDPVVTPLEAAPHYSEALALMPHCYQPNDSERPIGEPSTRAAAGLPEVAFVFCCFNQSYKFNPASWDTWCRLLAEVPGSVLWLLEPSAQAADHLRRETRDRGVDPARLVFAAKMPLRHHLARLQLADLALDTFPCNSHTTASDAIWAGVPLVTRCGATFAGRVAASLLQTLGMPELVAADEAEFFAIARAIALSPEALARTRAKLEAARRASPLFDTAKFTRDLERLYARVWEQHSRGARQAFALDPS